MIKRGAGNVEFILSFILFIGFAASALYFFNPIRNLKSVEPTRDYIMGVLIENTSVELEEYSIIITTSDLGKKNFRINIPGISPEKNPRVVDYYGNLMDSGRDSENVCFTRNSGETFATIYLSEDFPKSSKPCGGAEDYEIASSSTKDIMSEKRILQLNTSYYEDYLSLKNQLAIPAGTDFSFTFEFPDGQIISGARASPVGREIFSETKTKEILRSDGEVQFGYFIVKAW